MGFFSKLFGKSDSKSTPKGFEELMVREVRSLSPDTVEIRFEIPNTVRPKYNFVPGQYVNVHVTIDGKDYRRSYSLCSHPNDILAIAVKKVDQGIVSTYLTSKLDQGNYLLVSTPEGNFTLNNNKNIVAIAAGSGITPIMSMAKSIEKSNDANIQLFYANKTQNDVLFKEELKDFQRTNTTYFFTKEAVEGAQAGRITKESFTEMIKANLSLLKADGFYICGPEEMIFAVKEVLEVFGVAKDKVHFELFTTPTATENATPVGTETGFKGDAAVTVILDGEEFNFKSGSDGRTILDNLMNDGADAPYSCRGGVCSSCKAKVVEGTVKMNLNYTLTDKEIAEGYILTCQSHPTSEKVKITFDA